MKDEGLSAKLSEAIELTATALEEVLTEQVGERPAFILIVGPFNRSACRVSYISNVVESQTIEILRETATMIEAGGAPMAHKNPLS